MLVLFSQSVYSLQCYRCVYTGSHTYKRSINQCLQEINKSISQQRCTNTNTMLVLFSQITSLESVMLEVSQQRCTNTNTMLVLFSQITTLESVMLEVCVMIIIMYIYHALINALSAHMMLINLNMIFHTHAEQSPNKTTHTKHHTKRPHLPPPPPPHKNQQHWIQVCMTLICIIHTSYMCLRMHTHTHTNACMHTHTVSHQSISQ